MPIVVVGPPVGSPFGPGYQINVSTTTIGPFLDAKWRIELFDGLGEILLAAEPDIAVADPHTPLVIRFLRNDLLQPFAHPKYQDGFDGQLKFFLLSSSSVAESSTVNIKLETQTGWQWRQDQHLSQVPTEGGFTESDREALAVTQAAVQVPFPISTAVGSVAQVAIGSMFGSAPVQLLSRQECQALTGSGSLARPSPGFDVNALGFSFDFLNVPTFMGRAPGALLEFEQRIVQFVVVQRDFTGVDHAVQVIDAHSDNQVVTWGMNAPTRIDYEIAPGCTVQFCWLLLLGS